MHVFFQPDLSQSSLLLNEEESKHCVRVLRLAKGDEVHLADGKGTHAIAVITDDHPKKCALEITERIVAVKNRNYHLHLLVAPTKNMDRIEWFLEKATEAGIDEVTFIETINSERDKVNMERCEKILVSAMKQSKQWFLPELHSITKLSKVLPEVKSDLKLIAWCETPQTELISKHLKTVTGKQANIAILIGPEGDFTQEETTLAQQSGFIPSSLGNSILRTETAALYACMAVKTLFD
jgi:16S rRNA (uracil1498-N3)-methyltransferase